MRECCEWSFESCDPAFCLILAWNKIDCSLNKLQPLQPAYIAAALHCHNAVLWATSRHFQVGQMPGIQWCLPSRAFVLHGLRCCNMSTVTVTSKNWAPCTGTDLRRRRLIPLLHRTWIDLSWVVAAVQACSFSRGNALWQEITKWYEVESQSNMKNQWESWS